MSTNVGMNTSVNRNDMNNSYVNMKRKSEEEEKQSKRIASGERVNSAADDAASLAISEYMRGQIKGVDQASENAEDGRNMLKTAEGGISAINDMTQRARELAVQAGNGIYSDSQKQMMNQEFKQISEGISDVVKNTQFNGKKLLDGSSSEMKLQTGANSGETTDVNLDSANMSGLNMISGLDLSGDIGKVLESIDSDIESVNTAGAELGSMSNRLEHTVNNLDNSSINLAKSESNLRDADMAKEAMDLNKSRIMRTAQMGILSQQNQSQEMVMKILQG